MQKPTEVFPRLQDYSSAAMLLTIFRILPIEFNLRPSRMAFRSSPPYQVFAMPPPMADRQYPAKLPAAELKIDLPRQQYKTVKLVPIPFDPRVSNGGRFNSLFEAMLFIGRHCMFHHRSFTQDLAKMYLPFCQILNFTKGGYVPPTHLKKREFDLEFNSASRLVSSAH
jgi:hypothetical protein